MTMMSCHHLASHLSTPRSSQLLHKGSIRLAVFSCAKYRPFIPLWLPVELQPHHPLTDAVHKRPPYGCAQSSRRSTHTQLVVTTLESKFRTYDMRTQHPEAGFAHLSEKAHKSTVWLARHLPQNRDLFMTGGGNGGFNLYKYHYPNSRTKNDKVWWPSRTRAGCSYYTASRG